MTVQEYPPLRSGQVFQPVEAPDGTADRRVIELRQLGAEPMVKWRRADSTGPYYWVPVRTFATWRRSVAAKLKEGIADG